MWGFLLFAGVGWLAITWSVLRLEPGDVASVAGPVILFAAVTEAVRALAGTRTWWLNAGMALLFAATGALLLVDDTSSWTTPAALIGWFLLVRGAADIAISMMSRETDRIWGLLLVVGVAEAGLGFFAASAFARTVDLVIMVLGGAALARAVADLVAALRLREATAASRGERLLELPPERAIGVAGYTAGLTDFEAGAPAGGAQPRHRAAPRPSAAAMSDLATPGAPAPGVSAPGVSALSAPALSAPALGAPAPAVAATVRPSDQDGPSGSFHDEVLRTTADLDAMLALAGVTGAAVPGAAARAAAEEQIEVPDTPAGAELPALEDTAAAHRRATAENLAAERPGVTFAEEAATRWTASGQGEVPANKRTALGQNEEPTNKRTALGQGEGTATGWATPGQSEEAATGWATPGHGEEATTKWATLGPADEATTRRVAAEDIAAAHRRATVEEEAAHRRAAHEEMAAMHRRAASEGGSSLPLLDPAARASEPAAAGMDDTSIIMRSRLLD